MGPSCEQNDGQTPLKNYPSQFRWRMVKIVLQSFKHNRNVPNDPLCPILVFSWRHSADLLVVLHLSRHNLKKLNKEITVFYSTTSRPLRRVIYLNWTYFQKRMYDFPANMIINRAGLNTIWPLFVFGGAALAIKGYSSGYCRQLVLWFGLHYLIKWVQQS